MSTPLRQTLDQLLDLQKIDSEIERLARRRRTMDTGAARRESAQKAFDETQSARDHLSQLNGRQKDAELEQTGIETKSRDYEERLRSGRMTNPREFSNVEKEISQLHRRRSALDEKLLNLMDEIEQLRTRLEALEATSLQAEQEVTAYHNLYRANIGKIDADTARLVGERANAYAAIADKTLLQRYDTLRSRPANGGVAIAAIDDRHCGGCRTQISTLDEDRVRDGGKLALCDNCGRILA